MGNAKDYDFGAYATKYDVECDDGRTIRRGAFAEMDGVKVPMVYNHNHKDLNCVLGHAILESREDGMYAYGYFNDTEIGRYGKECVKHGDIESVSIYANKLKQRGGDVIHGVIRELSIVLAGANPEARIESILAHGDDLEDAMIIPNTETEIELCHASKEDAEEKKEETAETKEESAKEETAEPEKKEDKEENVIDVIESMTDTQQKVTVALIKLAEEGKLKEEPKEKGGKEDMKHNAFDVVGEEKDEVLQHDALAAIIRDGKKNGTLKESFLAHSAEYGIDHIDYIQPEFKNVNGQFPGFIKRQPDAWVDVVMAGVHHTPFSKVKMVFADLTPDEARAKGYIKGNYKEEEVFSLLKREVGPTTIYKKQKMDRDDIVDITDFDVVAWLKSEMRMMLDEEIARAILFGDGRSSVSNDKIKETCIIPIAKDAELYTIEKTVALTEGGTLNAADIIDAALEAQDDYEGGGNLIFFCSRKTLTSMRLLKDLNLHRLYKDANEVALACGVSRIVPVPAAIIPNGTIGVIVDLNDYNVGADKGGAVNMFDDFDIDYNQEKYLIETRCSGALTKPYSAIVLKKGAQG